jgi:hypothetical protein
MRFAKSLPDLNLSATIHLSLGHDIFVTIIDAIQNLRYFFECRSFVTQDVELGDGIFLPVLNVAESEI